MNEKTKETIFYFFVRIYRDKLYVVSLRKIVKMFAAYRSGCRILISIMV